MKSEGYSGSEPLEGWSPPSGGSGMHPPIGGSNLAQVQSQKIEIGFDAEAIKVLNRFASALEKLTETLCNGRAEIRG